MERFQSPQHFLFEILLMDPTSLSLYPSSESVRRGAAESVRISQSRFIALERTVQVCCHQFSKGARVLSETAGAMLAMHHDG